MLNQFLKRISISIEFGINLENKIKILYTTFFSRKRWIIGRYGIGTVKPEFSEFKESIKDLCNWAIKEDRDINAPAIKIIKEIALQVKNGVTPPEIAIEEILSTFGYITVANPETGDHELVFIRRYNSTETYLKFKESFNKQALTRLSLMSKDFDD
jgi:hypothetical protein